MKQRQTRCDVCNRPLGSMRVYNNGRFYCEACLYREEIGEPVASKRRRPAPLQSERLFPLAAADREALSGA